MKEHFDQFACMLRNAPLIPYSVDPTSHLHIIDAFMTHCAEASFPLNRAPTRKKWISATSSDLISRKSAALKLATACGRKLKWAPVRTLLRAWRSRCFTVQWHALHGFGSKRDIWQRALAYKQADAIRVQLKAYLGKPVVIIIR